MAEDRQVDPSETPYRAPWLPPRSRLPLLPLLPATLGALVAIAAMTFTANKLVVGARLRGDIDGIEGRMVVLLQEVRRFDAKSAEYSLGDAFTREPLGYTIQLRESQAATHRSGKAMFVRCLDDERACYTRGSVYISDGNRNFDLVLLGIELLGLGVALRALAWHVRAWRMSIRPPSGKIEPR